MNLANPCVLLPHLACAAYELPLSPDDDAVVGRPARRRRSPPGARRPPPLRDGRAFWSGRGSPPPGIGLRSGSPDEFRIAELDGRLVGTVDASRAFEQVHPGAIYLHLGQQYRWSQLDLDDRVAHVEPVDVDEYTQARSDLSVTILGTEATPAVGRFGAAPRRGRDREPGRRLRADATPAPGRCSGARRSTSRRPGW